MRLRRAFAAAVAAGACATTACSGPASVPASAGRQLTALPHGTAAPHGTAPYGAGAASAGAASPGVTGPGGQASAVRAAAAVPGRPLPPPTALAPFARPAAAGEGRWSPAGRPVSRNGHSIRVVYQTTLIPPGSTQAAGIAWMDAGLLSARLYSGSVSPGGGPYRYTSPIQPAQAATLVAAFNGGFKMNQARGGYYTEGRVIDPLRAGAASLVIYADGSVDIGAWGSEVRMTPQVVSVRQNLLPLVAGGRPTSRAYSSRWLQTWGDTCGATSCGATVPGVEHQWRSGLGLTADGALVYVAGPVLDPLQLAELLVRAGAVRGMQLDINPNWPVLATYDPPAGTLAGPANGSKLLASTTQGPATFFQASWARDFITMSARQG
jgi:hypothetical protein